MTFSIVARSADGTAHGVAVASNFPGARAAVPAALAGVGAVACCRRGAASRAGSPAA